MERTSVSPDDALRGAKESHQWAEFTIIANGLGFPAGGSDLFGERFLARAIIYDTRNL